MSRLAYAATADSSIPAIGKVICDHSTMFYDEAKAEAEALVLAKQALRSAVAAAANLGGTTAAVDALVQAHVGFNSSLYARYGTSEVAELINLECIRRDR